MDVADELFDRQYRTVTPYDLDDPPRTGQAVETLVDVLVAGVERFFTQTAIPQGRLAEVPTVRKYLRRPTSGLDYPSVVEVLRDNPGIFESLPHVVIWVSDATQLPLSVSTPYLATVQEPPRIQATLAGPYDLSSEGSIVFRTEQGLETRTMWSRAFVDPAAATAEEVAEEVNSQSLTLRATVPVADTVDFRPSNPTPNFIEVDAGSDDDILAAFGLGLRGTGDSISASVLVGTEYQQTLTDAAGSFIPAHVGRYVVLDDGLADNDGRWLIVAQTATTITYVSTEWGAADPAFVGSWFIGERDDHLNTQRPPMHRLGMRDLCGVSIEIVAEDPNLRTELADLVHSYLTLFWEREYFNYQGRGPAATGAAIDSPVEQYQAVLASTVRRGGRFEANRPDDGVSKVWVETISFQAWVEQFLDRPVRDDDGNNWFFDPENDLIETEDFDAPDFA